MNLNEFTIENAHEGLKKKEFSSEDLTKSCLEHIEKVDKNINAFITILKKEALDSAREIDKKKDFKNYLAGIPLAIKDNMSILGVRTTAGSRILENFYATYDATAVKKLKEAGAIFLGKANMDEFACGSSNETSYYGPVKNPHDLERVPGGSSGGSTAAVAANECIAALGSDTGGSIRQPASLCGIVGLKPTYGRVSRYGLLAMASSLDQIGPLTKTVKDSAILFQTIAGQDLMDSTTTPSNSPFVRGRKSDFPLLIKEGVGEVDGFLSEIEKDIRGLKIGVPKEYFSAEMEGLDKEVRKRIEEAIKKLEKLGAEIDDTISLPHSPYALAVYYVLMPSELSSNLERFDGVKYGYSNRSGKTLLDNYMDTRGEGFGAEIRRRIMLGTYALSAGYYDAYYKKALKVRTLVLQDFLKAFERVDCIVSPTSPTVAFKLGEKINDPLSMYLGDVYTVSANIAGIPAISIPCGMAKPKDGKTPLPVGLQIMGKHFDEATILRVARNFES